MSRGSRLALMALVAVMAVAGVIAASREDGATAQSGRGSFIRRAPNIARDGSHPAPAPLPTPTPTTELAVVVRVEMTVMEESVVGGGTTPITIKAEARTTNPLTRADVFVTAHPSDAFLKCDWTTVYTRPKVKIAIVNWDGIFTRALRLAFDQPEGEGLGSAWHFDITCYPEPPAPPQHLRWPPGERSVGQWLGLIGGANGIVIDTPDYNGSPDCIKRHGIWQHANVFGTAKISVYVVTPGCNVPSPPPVQPPAASPGGQNPSYDPVPPGGGGSGGPSY